MNSENMQDFKIDLRNTNTEELTLLFKILTANGKVFRESLRYFLSYERDRWGLLVFDGDSWNGDHYRNTVDQQRILSVKEFCDKFYIPESSNVERYITPCYLFNGNIKKGTLYRLTDAFDNNTMYYPKGYSQLTIYCLPPEIVTTWEKYNSAINITYDDVDEGSNIIYHITTHNDQEWLGLRNICKINDKQLESYHYCMSAGTEFFKTRSVLTHVDDITSIRKATQEECDFLIDKIVEHNKTIK